ncbi:MAG: helicase-related protein, partial [Thermoanaerobaculia bacterium]
RSPETIQIGRRANPAESVTQFVYETTREGKLPLLLHLLRDANLDSVLIFSRTKHGADKIARKLASSGVNTATLHSNRSQSQRQVALREFKSGKVRVLVATDIAARGIDVEGISHVVNYDFPPQPEDYVHRIGRTGRAKAVGDAISFVTPDDAANLRALEKFIGRGIPRKRAEGVRPLPEPAHAPSRPQRPHTRPATHGRPAPTHARSTSTQGRRAQSPAEPNWQRRSRSRGRP